MISTKETPPRYALPGTLLHNPLLFYMAGVSLDGRCVSFNGSQALQAGPLTTLGDVPRKEVWLI